MRVWTWILLVALVWLAPASVEAAIAIVNGQTASCATGAADTQACAYPGSVTADHLSVVQGSYFSVGQTAAPTVTNTCSTTYTVFSGNDGVSDAWYIAIGKIGASGACTVTVNPPGSSADIAFTISEWSGQHPTTPLDVDGGSAIGQSTTPSAAITTGASNALILAVVANWSGSGTFVLTPGSDYIQLGEQEDYNSSAAYNAVYRLVTTPQQYTIDWSSDRNMDWGIYRISIAPDTGGGGGGGGCTGRLLLLGVGC